MRPVPQQKVSILRSETRRLWVGVDLGDPAHRRVEGTPYTVCTDDPHARHVHAIHVGLELNGRISEAGPCS